MVYTGRPLRAISNDYVVEWDTQILEEQKKLLAQGKVPFIQDFDANSNLEIPYLAGQAAANIENILTAQEIVDQIVNEAVFVLKKQQQLLIQSKL